MFVPLELTPSTVILVVVILALAFLAVRRIVGRGLCDCHDHCGDASSKTCGGCHGCQVADSLVEKMNNSLKE